MKKLWSYILIGLKAIGKFLRWLYASELTILFLAVLIYLSMSKFLGIVFAVWAVLLAFNQYEQKQNGTV